jgi:hypothetical protein
MARNGKGMPLHKSGACRFTASTRPLAINTRFLRKSNSGVGGPIDKVLQQFGATEGTLASHRGEITGYHLFNEVLERDSMTPPEFLVRLALIA